MSVRRPRVAFAALAVLVIATACSSGGSNGAGSDSTATSSDAPTSSTTTSTFLSDATSSTTPIASDPLVAGLILKTVPSGLSMVPDLVSDSGPTNLAKAQRDEASDGGRVQLTLSKFVAGYQREWASLDGSEQNTIFLYRFATAAGAAAYALNRARELNAFPSDGPIKTFNVPMPGGVGLHSESKSNSFGAVVYSKGLYSVQAVSTDGIDADQSLAAVTLAQAQFALLP